MKKEKIKQKIKEESEEFFKKMGFSGILRVEAQEGLTFSIFLKIEEPQVLIGKKGETLMMIQHLLGKILKKKISKDLFIDLDIDDYKKKKINFLRELAQLTADEVALHKKEKELEPMPAYERRIIHLTLAQRKDVFTESKGKEPRRRVVIKPQKN
jgi:spoIIIJ-associated protein